MRKKIDVRLRHDGAHVRITAQMGENLDAEILAPALTFAEANERIAAVLGDDVRVIHVMPEGKGKPRKL